MDVPDDSSNAWPPFAAVKSAHEEICTLKSKSLFSVFALVAAAILPLAATGQVAPDRTATPPTYKYMAYAGLGYTSINHVNQSRYGLLGVDLAISRDFGRFFAVTADGAFYQHSAGSGNAGNPSMDYVLFGPELHGTVYERWSVFARALLGGAHTGGTGQTPKISFAGGAGMGVQYEVNPRWVIRISGDSVASSFSVTNNTAQEANSSHTRRNARASLGIGYRF